MIVWTLLIILALIVIGIVTLKLYHKQREAEFQNSYSQAQIENQKKFIQQVANTPDSKPMTAAEQKAYFDSVKAADASQSSQAQADQSAYLEQVAARDRAVEAGARADYDKTH
ncbi:MAG: hypothetical protein JWM20_962 [Patescibacteria group bacterium]|nr:hypothetical protein [Patescibacteria group bacterium]